MNPTDIDWVKIRNEYVTGNISQRALVEQYGIARRGLETRCSREGWVAAREEYRKRVSALAEEKAAEQQADCLAAYVVMLREGIAGNGQLLLGKIRETMQYGEPFSPRDLKSMSGVLNDLVQQMKALGEDAGRGGDVQVIEWVNNEWDEI